MPKTYYYTRDTDGCDETWVVYQGKKHLFSIGFWEMADETEAIARHAVAALNAYDGKIPRIKKHKLPPDPDGLNDQRATRAAIALGTSLAVGGIESQNAPFDLLCDLMHWCDRNRVRFETEVNRATYHYVEETIGKPIR